MLTAGPPSEPAVLLFFVFTEIHPIYGRVLTLAIALIQVQYVAVLSKKVVSRVMRKIDSGIW